MVLCAPRRSAAVGSLPALKLGWITFGCLNQLAKVTRPVLATMGGDPPMPARLPPGAFNRIPALILIRCVPSSSKGGITGERVEFVAGGSRREYLRRYHDLDLCLDPFPYNGHTSTLDALWMGVPVITLAGRTGVGLRGGERPVKPGPARSDCADARAIRCHRPAAGPEIRRG